MAHPYWPMFDLVIRTPRITMRCIDDAIGIEVVDVARRGVHDPAVMPFAVPWTDAEPEQIGRNSFQFWWQCRAETTPASWSINLAVFEGDQIVGASGINANGFPVTRTFDTGSWLGREFQGRGLGTELRIATLHLGFLGFDALVACTGAFTDNARSLGVTRKLGYVANGVQVHERRGVPAELEHYRMTRDHFLARVRRDDVEIVGDGPVREMLGVSR